MKNLTILFFVFLFLQCSETTDESTSDISVANQFSSTEHGVISESIQEALHTKKKSSDIRESYGEQVKLEKEMIILFDPDNFNCGLSEKIKAKLKSYENEESRYAGFVPSTVRDNLKYDLGYKMDGKGTNILLHYFILEKNKNEEKEPLITIGTPTQENYSLYEYIDNQKEGYEDFFFTMDCSGYFSISANIAAKGGFLGFGKADIAAEGKKTIGKSQSIFIARCILISPLYSAYKGYHMFEGQNINQSQEKELIKKRIKILNGIINALPNDTEDNWKIHLNTNIETIITSNNGNSGFNGSGSLNSNLSVNISSAQTKTGVSAKNSVSRKSQYTNFDTYIIKLNVLTSPLIVEVKDIKNKIKSLKKRI